MHVDPESHLQTAHLQEGLRERSVSGAFFTLLTQWLKFVLHLGSLYVLARILTPGDFGLIGMVTAVTGLILHFKDMGLSAATVQRDKVSHDQVSTLFWINVALSTTIMLIAAAISPLIARFYNEPRLTWITLALAGGFLISGLGMQHMAVLSRQMRFRALALIEVASQAAAVAAALLLAGLGAGYWALVGQQLVLATGIVAGAWLACGWRPGPPRRGAGVRPMIRFGGNLTGFGLVNYFARHLDDVLIGRFWGAGALGLYTKAYGLLLMPLNQVNFPVARIAIPTLSRLQDQLERHRRFYLKALRLIALATMPLVATMWVLSREVVLIVLGPQWTGAAELFSVMAVAAFVQPALNTSGWVYVSLGQANRMARWGALWALLYCASFVIGLPWGAWGVALAYTIAVYALALPGIWAALRFSAIGIGDFLQAVARPATLGLVIAAAGWAARRQLDEQGPWPTLLIAGAASLGAALALALLWPSLRRELLELRELWTDLKKGLGSGTTAG
jgi:PST family polysaccharide transporter